MAVTDTESTLKPWHEADYFFSHLTGEPAKQLPTQIYDNEIMAGFTFPIIGRTAGSLVLFGGSNAAIFRSLRTLELQRQGIRNFSEIDDALRQDGTERTKWDKTKTIHGAGDTVVTQLHGLDGFDPKSIGRRLRLYLNSFQADAASGQAVIDYKARQAIRLQQPLTRPIRSNMRMVLARAFEAQTDTEMVPVLTDYLLQGPSRNVGKDGVLLSAVTVLRDIVSAAAAKIPDYTTAAFNKHLVLTDADAALLDDVLTVDTDTKVSGLGKQLDKSTWTDEYIHRRDITRAVRRAIVIASSDEVGDEDAARRAEKHRTIPLTLSQLHNN